jgi:type IV pilus assembly protein PilA
MQHPHAVTRDREPEAGFTLIELMMVVLIIAILIAVLIPTFVGAKRRAQDRAMQSSIRNALTAAKVVYSEHGDYTQATVAGLTAAEPGIAFVAAGTAPVGQNAVSIEPVSTTYFRIAGQSRSGACFFLSDDESASGVGVLYATASGGSCTASSAPAAGDPSWTTSW